MCTELFLAFLYFIAIVGANYFIFKLIQINYKNLLYLLKIEKVFKNFTEKERKRFFYFLIKLKKEVKNIESFDLIKEKFNTTDNLIIGYTYKYLAENITSKDIKKQIFISNKLYFKLLENQYLFKI
jgi:hypothetical protein